MARQILTNPAFSAISDGPTIYRIHVSSLPARHSSESTSFSHRRVDNTSVGLAAEQMALTNFILTVGASRPGCYTKAPAAAARCRCPSPPQLNIASSLAAVGVGAVAMLMSKDIRQSSAMLRRNMRHIRTWLEEQGAAAE